MRWFGWFREPESTPEIHSPSFWGRIQPAREYRPCAVKTCRTLFLYQGKEGDGSEKCASCAGRALTALSVSMIEEEASKLAADARHWAMLEVAMIEAQAEHARREAEQEQPARVVAIGRKR